MVRKGSCIICTSPKRLNTDRALIRGETLAGIASAYGWNVQTLRRHKEEHLHHQLAVSMEKQQLAQSTDLLGEVTSLRERVESVINRNNNKKGDLTMLKAVKEARGVLELLLKIELAIHETSSNRSNADDEQAAQEAQEQYAESLQKLTTPELAVWNQLIDKINTGNSQVIIKETGEFSTTKYVMSGFGSEFDGDRGAIPTRKKEPRQRMRRKKLNVLLKGRTNESR